MTQYLIIFDIETLGLPIRWDAPANDIHNWPGILEIAWQLYDDKKQLISEESLLIQIKNGELSIEIQDLTGITEQYVNENGISILTALKEFISVLQKFKPILVAHNCDFDTKVVEAALLKNNIDFSLSSFEVICTMKASMEFCGLPNKKYPKLIELYQKLFNEKPTKQHRALNDVEITAKCLFKLIDLGVIQIKNKEIGALDLAIIKRKEIDNAIECYISDINNYPIFYDIDEIRDLPKKNISDLYNKFYQTAKARTFEIPYNQVAERKVISLKAEDIIIKYILKNHVQENINFISSLDKYNEKTISILFKNEIEKGNCISIKLDIYDCYESIDHDLLIDAVSNSLSLTKDSTFLTVFNNALKIIYQDTSGNIIRKQKGVLIGSKPDEYFADFYLNEIEETVKIAGISIIRISDEFIFFTKNLSDARKTFSEIKEIIERYGLSVNKSKTTIKDYREDVMNPKLDLLIIDGVSSGSIPLNTRSFEVVEKHQIKVPTEINFGDNVKPTGQFDNKMNLSIDSYESSILFLKKLLSSRNEIRNYQTKYPYYEYLYNIILSQPTDFRNDYRNLDLSVFDEENILELKKIIFNYPKSEYYTAVAIDLLIFAAINTIYDDNENYGVPQISHDLTRICRLANLTILEILKSSDIHDYQKYLLLRALFKNKNDPYVNLENYRINYLYYSEIQQMEHSSPSIPFKEEIIKEVRKLVYSFPRRLNLHYALKMICYNLSSQVFEM